MAMNEKKRRFAEEFLVDQHITKAAVRAGYSEKTAYSQGSRLMKDVEVQALIQAGLEKLKKESEKRAAKKGITKERWLKEMSQIAFANMDDFAKIELIEVNKVSNGNHFRYNRIGVKGTLTAERKRSLGAAIKKVSDGADGVTVELHSKKDALEMIGRHFGWLDQKDDPKQSGVTVNISLPSNGKEAKKPDGGST